MAVSKETIYDSRIFDLRCTRLPLKRLPFIMVGDFPADTEGPMKRIPMKFTVNGKIYERMIEPWRLLVEVLREELGLTGTKIGCDDGSCGACTVLLEGIPVQSCLVLAASCQNKPIITIEGLGEGPEMDVVQRAFMVTGGSQCGFCTPGFVISVRDLLNRNKAPDRAAIMEALSSNFCRCTGYTKIVAAVEQAIADTFNR